MGTEKKGTDFMNGVPELLILRLLAHREMYGYEIVRGIRLSSNEQLNFGEGVIYPLLHAMEKKRLIRTRRATVNSRPRIYYRLTAKGQKKLQTTMSHWQQVTTTIQAILEDSSDASETA